MKPGLMTLLWKTLPERLGARCPWIRHLLTDGFFLTRWPLSAQLISPLALVLGVAMAVIVRVRPLPLFAGAPHSPLVSGLYSQSILFLLAAVAVGMLSRQAGLMLWLGYCVPDLLLHLGDRFLGLPRLYGDLLLAVPTLLLAGRLERLRAMLAGRPETLGAMPVNLRSLTPPLQAGLVGAVLTWVWTLAFPFLVQPVWAWNRGGTIPAGALRLTGGLGLLVAAVGGLAAYARQRLAALGPKAPPLPRGAASRSGGAAPPCEALLRRWLPAAGWPRALVLAAGTTLLIAGMLSGLLDLVAVLAFLTAYYGARQGLLQPKLPPLLAQRYEALPAAWRQPAVYAGTAVLSWLVMFFFWGRSPSFRPLLFDMALFLVAFQVMQWLGRKEAQAA